MPNTKKKPVKRYTKAAVKPFVKKGSKLLLSRALNKVGASNPRVKSHVKCGDEIVVIAGADKGKISKVLEVYQNGKILVEGVNIKTKHKKAYAPGQESEISKVESPIYASNVMIWDETTKKASRVGKKVLEDGKKVRISKASGEQLD
jgi:large subunit ribosomal protein L24